MKFLFSAEKIERKVTNTHTSRGSLRNPRTIRLCVCEKATLTISTEFVVISHARPAARRRLRAFRISNIRNGGRCTTRSDDSRSLACFAALSPSLFGCRDEITLFNLLSFAREEEKEVKRRKNAKRIFDGQRETKILSARRVLRKKSVFFKVAWRGR